MQNRPFNVYRPLGRGLSINGCGLMSSSLWRPGTSLKCRCAAKWSRKKETMEMLAAIWIVYSAASKRKTFVHTSSPICSSTMITFHLLKPCHDLHWHSEALLYFCHTWLVIFWRCYKLLQARRNCRKPGRRWNTASTPCYRWRPVSIGPTFHRCGCPVPDVGTNIAKQSANVSNKITFLENPNLPELRSIWWDVVPCFCRKKAEEISRKPKHRGSVVSEPCRTCEDSEHSTTLYRTKLIFFSAIFPIHLHKLKIVFHVHEEEARTMTM